MKYLVNELNLLTNNTSSFVRIGDDKYFNQLYEIVDVVIKQSKQSPIVLLAGPSGSGKTTTAMNLERILDEKNHQTHIISLDNYFKDLNDEELKLYEEGELDLESPNRLDKKLLNEQLKDLIEGKSVKLFKYDFKKSKRVDTGEILSRKENEIIILEGTHSLNPDLIMLDSNKFIKLYVSVDSEIKNATSVLSKYDLRLFRRMIRDRNFRARAIATTLKMKDSVDEGEKKYIEPYKNDADYVIDSFILYEANVYKKLLLDDLIKLNSEAMQEAITILKELKDIDEIVVPASSLIKEFLGHGNFHY